MSMSRPWRCRLVTLTITKDSAIKAHSIMRAANMSSYGYSKLGSENQGTNSLLVLRNECVVIQKTSNASSDVLAKFKQDSLSMTKSERSDTLSDVSSRNKNNSNLA